MRGARASSALNVIFIILGEKSHYNHRFPRFEKPPKDYHLAPDFGLKFELLNGIGILTSINNEFSSDMLFSSDVVWTKDFLGQILFEAQTLLNSGYLPAASVYCRVFIESMIKKIADQNNILYDNKTKLIKICQDLKDNDIIQLPDWRQLMAWIDLGNEAAHGIIDNCEKQSISQMIRGISNFEEKYLK